MRSELRHLVHRARCHIATLCLVLLLTLSATGADAATCSYTNFNIGMEVVAVEGPSAGGEYRYLVSTIRCNAAGQVIYDSGSGFSDAYDMGWIQPASLLSAVQGTFGIAQARIFVSGCNTHLLTVNKYGPSYKSVAGVSMASYPVSNTPYIDVFKSTAYLKPGPDFALAHDPATGACTLRPDSGLNAGMCVAGVANGFGSTSANGTNPINPAWRGNKIQRETDYNGVGAFPLHFVRTYNSRAARVAGLTSGFDSAIAGTWTHTYQRALQRFAAADNTGNNSVQSAAVFRPDGKIVVFNPSGSDWVTAAPHVADTLTHQPDGTWRYLSAEDDTETYSAAGKLTAITNRAGLTQTLSYDINGRLSQVTDSFGRTLTFTYDTNGRLATLTDPGSGVTQYAYDSQSNPITVTYPGGGIRSYHYDNAAYPKALTGITDENAQRTATYTYDTQGRAIFSEHGASGSGIDLHSVTYNANGSATISDAVGTARTFSYLDQFSTGKLAGASQPGGAGCGPAAQAVTYDANGFIASRTDFKGVQTTYVHSARGLETSRTEAFGTPQARTIATTWHATLHLPTQIDEPGRRTTFGYDPAGNLLTKTLTDMATSAARTWTTTYNAAGQPLTVDGPRTDVLDKITYTYYTDSTASHTLGDLATVTDALGHLTQFTSYDKHGRPLAITDPNGITTTLTYTPRGWLSTGSVGGQTTTTTYDNVGQRTRLTLGDGSHTDTTYDAAHRLSSVTDSRGNAIDYSLDNAGHVTNTHWQNADSSTAKSTTAQYDALGRPQTVTDGLSHATTQTFDANGNRTGVTDPKSQTTAFAWDALNRPTRVTDAAAGITTASYNALDQLSQVAAPNNATTTYTRDALDNLKTETSADRGTTQATYDEAGNPKTITDARGIVANLTYDALNRPLTVTYPSTGQSISTVWDSAPGCVNGIGRRCKITDAAGSTTYAYDARGNLVSETRVIGSTSFTTQYAHDAADRLSTIITPAGKVISLTRDSGGQIQSVAAPVAGTGVILAQNIQTNALGETTAQTLGNGVSETRTFDAAGQAASVTDVAGSSGGGTDADGDVPTLPEWGAILLGALLLGLSLRHNAQRHAGPLVLCLALGLGLFANPDPAQADETLSYDASGNIIQRIGPTGTTTYGYDALDRLKNEAGPAKTQTLTYDPNGNRTSDASGTHTYSANSDRQVTIAGQAVTLDAAGHITQARGLGYVWNAAGQLKEVHQGSPTGTLLASYDYDGQNRRIRKITTAAAAQGATTVLYLYDLYDRLLMEADAAGTPKVTYVWRDDIPVSLIVAGSPETVLYLETDHLNTPRAARNQAMAVVWRWESDAFGATLANEDPGSTGKKTTINLRFPGQYFDRETNLFYNMARYYDPLLGRYISSDPIGLAGGLNTFAYAGGDPLKYTDPLGLQIGGAVGGTAGGLGGLGGFGGRNSGGSSSGSGSTGNADLDAGAGYSYKKPSWPSWPPGGNDGPKGEPWPKDDKNFCIRTYVNCQNYDWTGNCQTCLDLCKGSGTGDWPFDMCKPRKKNQCE
jgi:RHS repeat-associated protein